MRPSQLSMIKRTADVRGHPFDLIDMVFGLLTAMTGSPIAFVFTFVQYFARRSAAICEALLVAMDLPDAIASTRPVRGLLPGVTKLLPTTAEDGVSHPAEQHESTSTQPFPAQAEVDLFNDVPGELDAREETQRAVSRLPRQVRLADLKSFPASSTAVPLGIDQAGRPRWLDLASDTLHIGLYGQTKCGKDTLLRAWYTVLAKRNAPDALQFAILDGKGDWLVPQLAGLAHMFIPPAGGYGRAGDDAIKAAIERIDREAQRRQQLITAAGCRTREQYINRTGKPMPLLVVCATDVMTSVAGDVEGLLIALVSKARALGLRVVVSMQTPTGRDTKWRMNLATVIAGSLQAGSQDEPALGISVKAMRYRPSLLPPPTARPGVFVGRIGGEQVVIQAPHISEEAFDAFCGTLPTRPVKRPDDRDDHDMLAALLFGTGSEPASAADFGLELVPEPVPATVVLTDTDAVDAGTAKEQAMIRVLLAAQHSANDIAALIGGNRAAALARIRAVRDGLGSPK